MDRKQHNIIILLLGALSAIGPFSVDMYLPGFAAIAHGLKTDIAHVGYSLTSYFIGISVGQLAYGPLFDRYGRKKPLIIGLGVYILSAIGCAFSPSIDWLIGLRLFLAIGGCAGMVASRAVVRDLFTERESAQVFSMLMAVSGIAPIIAPTVGSLVVVTLGWRAIFGLLGIIAAFVLVMVMLYLRESKGSDLSYSLRPKNILMEYLKVFREPRFTFYAVISAAAGGGGLFSYIAGSSFVFMKLFGFTTTEYGWIFGINSFGLIIASQINRILLRKHSSARILSASVIVQCSVAVVLVVGTLMDFLSVAGTVSLIFCYVFCIGFNYSNSTALALGPFTRNAGTASALIGSIQMIVGASASALVSYLHDGTAVPMISMMAVYAAFGLAVLSGSRLFLRK